MVRWMKSKFIISLTIVLLFFNTMLAMAQLSKLQDKPDKLSLSGTVEIRSYASRKYILGPNDTISIYVYDSPEFNLEKVMVQPDGKITITPLGALSVAGMTIEDLHNLLVKKYKFYLNDPQITVKLDKIKPFVVYVSGAVLKPGSYELNTDVNQFQTNYNMTTEVIIERKTPLLSNILVAAGGISYDADLEHIKVVNSIDGSNFEINLLELLETGNANQDIYLAPGDSVMVPRLPTPMAVNPETYKKYASASFSPPTVPVKVFGYVNNPGLVTLETSQSLNLNSAIVAAGGYLKDSAYAPKKVFLSRIDNNNRLVTRVVNPMVEDITLMPKDIIYVPEKPRPLGGKLFDYMTRVITPINTFANTYNAWSLMFDPHRFNFIPNF